MNNERRKRIAALQSKLADLKETLEECTSEARGLADDERETYDNMPESLQQGERGQQSDSAATELESVADALEEIDLESIDGQLESASE